MASFVALNVEPEEDSEEEVDNTKEIQIEEALKLYQNALKLHSQGAAFYGEADAAYDALFDSEIFTYPEALSEFKRQELYDALPPESDDFVQEVQQPQSVTQVSSSDGAPNALPQLLYLSYKNHGQFLLDRLVHRCSQRSGLLAQAEESYPDILATALDSLELFTEALGKDDLDSDLWRRTSRVGGLVGSQRIARYCLEAVLRSQSHTSGSLMANHGLEESFAMEDLKELMTELQDYLSESQLKTVSARQKQIPLTFRKIMNTYPQLPVAAQKVDLNILPARSTVDIQVPIRSWASVGIAILQQIRLEFQGNGVQGFGTRFSISLPDSHQPQQSVLLRKGERDRADGLLEMTGAPSTPSITSHIAEQHQLHNTEQVKFGNGASTTGSTLSSTIYTPANELERHETGDPSGVQNLTVLSPYHHLLQQSEEDQTTCGHEQDPTRMPALTSISLPTRKRTLESAGLPENADNGRVRSKRIRARAELAPDEENEAVDLARYYEDLLQKYVQADHLLTEFVNDIFARLGIKDYSLRDLRRILSYSDTENSGSTSSLEAPRHSLWRDFKHALLSWNLSKSHLLLQRDSLEDLSSGLHGGSDTTFARFLEYSKPVHTRLTPREELFTDINLAEFVSTVNTSWTSLDELSMLWLHSLLEPCGDGNDNSGISEPTFVSKYIQYTWPESLKETVVQMLVTQDEYLYATLQGCLEDLDQRRLSTSSQGLGFSFQSRDAKMQEMIQSIFELHLDIYGSITNPSSKVDGDIRIVQRDRLRRWAALSNRTMTLNDISGYKRFIPRALTFRFLWSSVMFVYLLDTASRDHVILCIHDLVALLEEAGSPVIELHNNAIMPEISLGAAERELSKLTTLDFFASVFDPAMQDPLFVIESLEPILLGSVSQEQSSTSSEQPSEANSSGNSSSGRNEQMIDFLNKATISLRLFLWCKLRTAYEEIDYPPMIFLCTIQSIRLVLDDLNHQTHDSDISESRTVHIVRQLATLDDLLRRALKLALENSTTFDCLNEENIKVATSVCADLTQLLYAFVVMEDFIRVGHYVAPSQSGNPATAAYKLAMNQLREMHVKAWMIQYLVLREAMSQLPEHFPTLDEDLANYLKLLHHTLGLRAYCGLAKKLFLKFANSELSKYRYLGCLEPDIAQVIFDICGLKVCVNSSTLVDHGSLPETLERIGALELVDCVMNEANKLNVKDLLKTELKGTIDKMQGIIGAPDPKSLAFNKRVLIAHLKSPLNPRDMFRCLRGIGGLSSIPVNTEHATIAKQGWYFLLGYSTLARFRAQKRVSPGPTDDLDIAIIFLRHDLEFGMEKWETWYRLAQAYDAKLEEETTWSAERLNGHMDDLVKLQRYSIHCYMMAVAISIRSADDSFDTVSKISDLYTDFGDRLYSSSREPFSMAVFDMKDYKRFFNNIGGTYERIPFRELQVRQALILASVLYRQALVDKPESWWNWYMLGKCLWKIHHSAISQDSQAGLREVLEAYTKAIQCVPEKKDNRHLERDPILEPHYKLVSFVHKLVQRRYASPEEGCRYLDATPYAAKVPHVQDGDDWEGYILSVLKSLRAADKSNWHHRMVARAAHVIYDDSSTDVMAAHGAKHELTQQIFTKTMSIQVWKPEYERAGRHFVYTRRYVNFFVQLLFQLGDRASLEALGKRVRKKPGEFMYHASLWSDICMNHLKLLRIHGAVPEGHDDLVFKSVPVDTFIIDAARLETWAHTPATLIQPTNTGKLVELLRESIELKKTNGTLLKTSLIDDLIGDIFARLYEIVVPELISRPNDDENRDRMRVNHLLMDDNAPTVVTSHVNAPQGLDEPGVRSRQKTASKREIIRRAEALVTKQVSLPPTSKAKPNLSDSMSAPTTEKSMAVLIERIIDNKEDPVAKEVPSSVPGSVHDSADDESELSDIVEDEEEEGAAKEQKPMFPGLLGRSGENDGGDTGDDDTEEDLTIVEEDDHGSELAENDVGKAGVELDNTNLG